MRSADALTRLHDHQAHILAHINASTALLRLDPLEARAQLAKNRWALARMLRAYQLFKHTEIFDPAIATGDERQAATARRLRADCTAAGELFAAYVARWSTADVATLWASYAPAMRRMAGQLQTHIARERIEVAALLEGADRTRTLASRDREPVRPDATPAR